MVQWICALVPSIHLLLFYTLAAWAWVRMGHVPGYSDNTTFFAPPLYLLLYNAVIPSVIVLIVSLFVFPLVISLGNRMSRSHLRLACILCYGFGWLLNLAILMRDPFHLIAWYLD